MNDISIKIGRWFDLNKRDLPWRHTRDAYRIWLSEIILQQTRVVQGLDYYLRFVDAYPTVRDLANTPLDQVLKLWQGLGYYSRARNLHAAARQVIDTWGDHFPTAYADLISLRGVGPYTAAAIASFASDEQVSVVDGNVYRLLSRLFDLSSPIDTGKSQREFQALADQLMQEAMSDDRSASPSRHNQSMMEFGALLCTPVSPRCEECPVASHCLALANGTITQRPVKQGKVKVRTRHLLYIIYIYKDTLWVHQRGEGDIWQGLWEFPLIEEPSSEQLTTGLPLFETKHQLTHQTLLAQFRIVQLPPDLDPRDNKAIQALGSDYRQLSWLEWQRLAVPRLIDEANKRLSAWF